MTYRYYIGLQLPGETAAKIEQLQKDLFDPSVALPPLEPHITLLPPPAVAQIDPDEFTPHIKGAVSRLWPVTFRLTEVITFDTWAIVISVQSPAVHELQMRLRDQLPVGTPLLYHSHPDFIPHVTLVEAIRGKHLPRELVDEARKQAASLLPAICEIDHLTLFRQNAAGDYIGERI